VRRHRIATACGHEPTKLERVATAMRDREHSAEGTAGSRVCMKPAVCDGRLDPEANCSLGMR